MEKSDFIKQELRTSSVRLKKKHSDLIKKIIPKSGSYDLHSPNNISQSNEEIMKDEVELNSAEPIKENSSIEHPSVLNNTTIGTTATNTNTNTSSTLNNTSNLFESFNTIQLPKKKTLLGIPLLCSTYFAAIYSLLAYGATSLLSIIELMMNNSPKLLPLYLLLAGYLLITLMSFLLIVAIQREKLNIILFWIISLSVFILPEIGLNIVLAENSFNWFNTTTGFYTLVALVVRVTIDIPCIGIILAYHINRTKRNNFLQKMIKPLKKNIMNGEVLKSYNNLDIGPEYRHQNSRAQHNLPTTQYPIVDIMPSPEINKKKNLPNNVTKIGFNPIFENSLDKNESENSSNIDEEASIIPEKVLNKENSNNNRNFNYNDSKKNAFYYKFIPGTNYEIYVRPSKTGEFVQRFVNFDDIKFEKETNNKKTKQNFNDYKSANKKPNKNNLILVQNEQVKSSKYDENVNVTEDNYTESLNYKTNTDTKNKKPNLNYVSIEKNIQFCDSEFNIPVQVETNLNQELMKKPKLKLNYQTIPFKTPQEVKQIYQNRLNQTINVSNHQIYLPTPSSMIEAPFSRSNKYLNQKRNMHNCNGIVVKTQTDTYSKGEICNCVNIASCSKDKINEFIHSTDCTLAKNLINNSNSSASMNLSNPDLFIQRKHF